MADDNIELGLKLSLKEFFASLQQAGKLTVAEVKKINEMMTQVKSTPLTVDQTKLKESEAAVNRLKESYYLLSLGEEEAAEKAMQFIQSQQLNSNQTDQLIQSLQNELRTLSLHSTEYKAVNSSIQGLIQAKQKLAASTNIAAASATQLTAQQTQLKTGSQNMNMAIMQSGYVLNDAAMIGVNFRFALMGIGNNIPFVVQGLMAAKNEASQMGKTLGQVALQSIKGPGGILLGINAIMFALQVLPGLFDSGTESIKRQKEAIKELADEYERLTSSQLKNMLSDAQKQLREFESKYPSKTETGFEPKRMFGGQSPFYQTNVSDDKRFGDDAEEVKTIKEKISLLERELLYKGKIDEANIRIGENRKKLDQLGDQNFSLIVPGAKSFDEAQTTINNWIAADEKIVKQIQGTFKEKTNKPLLDIDSDAELLKQLDFINNKLKDISLSEREIAQWKKLQLEINEKLYGPTGKSRELKPRLNTGESDARLVNPFDDGLAGSTKDELKQLAEKNKLLKEQKTTWQEMREVVRDAGKSMISAWTSSFNLIKRNQTMLEQFINGLARAIAEALALKAITSIFNVVTSILSAGSGAATAVPSGPGGGGGIFTKPVGGGFNYASAVATRGNTYSGGGSFVREVPYIAETRASGRDLKIIIKRQDEFNKDYR